MFSLTSLFGDDASILSEKDFQLLLLTAVLPVLGMSLLSPVLDSLIDPFGASSASIGLMISVFTAPSIVLTPVAGVLADRYGRKRILITSLVLFGLSGTGIAFTSDFRVALALRTLQGVGFAGLTPIIITSIGDLFSGEKEATGQGIRFMVSGISGAAFPLFSGVLVLLAWQYPFLLYAISFPVALGVYLWFDEPTTPSSLVADGGSTSYTRELFRLGRKRRVCAMIVARALLDLIWTGFVTYNSLIVIRLIDGTPVQAGILATVGFVMFATSASQAGRITSFFESRLYVLISANVCFSVGFAMVLFAPGIGIAGVGIALSGVGFGILGSLYRSIITGLAPADFRAGLVSIAEASARLTGTLTPLVMGGFIALGLPTLGFALSLRIAGLGLAIVGGFGGIICMLAARDSPLVSG